MATKTGAFSGISTDRVYPYVTYTSTQDSAANTSDVTVTLVFRSISAYYGYGTCSSTDLYCNGTQAKGSIAFNVAAGGSDTITSTTQTIAHDANGNASTTVGANGSTGISWGTFDFSTTYTLPTITRAATVTTQAATSVGQVSATANGTVTDAGVPACTRGVKWGTVSGSYPNTVASGSGAGAFTASITGLTAGTTYYYKAYATNSSGTVYGSEVSFETTISAPTVTTGSASSVAATTATVSGNVTSDGGATVTERGICYDTSTGPTTSDSKTTTTGTTGAMSVNLTSLTPSTLYYAKAYATNSEGTSYGAEITFTTISGVPTVTTTAGATSITSSTGTVAGNVTSDGGATVTERGFVYALTTNPTTANSKAVTTGTTGAMSKEITGLTPGTLYYFKAYATNSYGTAYGTESSFTTLPGNPSGLSAVVAGKTSISLSWTKGTNGTYSIVRRGLTPPANINSGDLVYQGTGASVTDTGLTAGTLYYYRVWSATTADWSVAYSASYSADSATTTSNFTNPENALTDGADYTTVPANDGVLTCQVSKDGGTTWSISKSLTFDGDVDTLSFGLGTTELWGTTFMGDDMNDGNFMIKLTGGSAGESYQIYKTFGFTIVETYQLTGVQVQVKATYDSSDILLYFAKVDAYYGDSPLPIGAGSLAYDTDFDKPTFYDGADWVPVLTTKDIDADLSSVSANDDTVPSAKATKAYIDDAKFTWKGPWATSTAYEANDMVENDGSGYVCILGHTSGASTEPGTGASWTTNWDLLVEGSSAQSAYPVGSIYINATDSTNPATLLGFGTWAAFGAGRVMVGLDSSDTLFDTAEETGGAKTHTLTSDEMPSHTHTQDAHQHGTSGFYTAGSSGSTNYSANSPVLEKASRSVAAATATNQNTGGGGAHNNLQPYITVYFWKRTA